jgi:hypothetical protein
MLVYDIEILLHYNNNSTDYPDCISGHKSWANARDRLISMNLLKTNETKNIRTYSLTERSRVYIKALIGIPLPEQHWVMSCPSP